MEGEEKEKGDFSLLSHHRGGKTFSSPVTFGRTTQHPELKLSFVCKIMLPKSGELIVLACRVNIFAE